MSDEAKVLLRVPDGIAFGGGCGVEYVDRDGTVCIRGLDGRQERFEHDVGGTEAWLVRELVAAHRWIPVTERLPEDVVTVAVYLPKFGEVLPLYYSARWDEWADGHGFSCGIAGTMWQPLPDPPQP